MVSCKKKYLLKRNYLSKNLVFSILCFTLVATLLHAAKSPVVRIIVVNTESEAESILSELHKGRTFASLAKERSIDEKTRDRFGEVDPAAFDSLDRPLKEAALHLGEGKVSEGITLRENKYALVLVVDMSYYRKGAKAFRAGDFKTAQVNLLDHVALNPDAVKARIILGRIYEAANEMKKAEVNFLDALRFDAGCEEAYLRLGALYVGAGQVRQAKGIYDEGLNHLPDSKSLRAEAEKTKRRLFTAKGESPKKETASSGQHNSALPDVRPLAPPAKAPLPEEVTPSEKEAGTPQKKSAGPGVAPLSKATSVNRIEIKKSEGTLKVLIIGNGAMRPKVFPISERIVIDIPGVSMHAPVPSSIVRPLKGIRTGRYKDKVRLVLDLKEKTAFDFSVAGNTLEVILKANDQPAPEPAVKVAQKETVADGTLPKESAKKEAPPENPKEKIPAAETSKVRSAPIGTSKTASEKKMHIRIIFLSKESDALDILAQIKKGRPFALLAKERSVDEKTRESYGYLGEIGVDTLHESIQAALSKMKEGQTSGVIKMDQNRYAVVQVTDMGLYREGEKAFIAGDYLTAERKLLRYVETNPDAVKARTMLGKIYENKEQPSKAIEMYKEAISFSPKTVLIYERLARVYLFLGMYLKAKEVYMQGLRQVPSSPVLEEGIEMSDMLLMGSGGKTP